MPIIYLHLIKQMISIEQSNSTLTTQNSRDKPFLHIS